MNNKNSKKSNNKKNTSKSIKNKNNKKVIKNKECNKYFKTLFMFSSLLNLLLIILSLILIALYIKNNNKINDLNENINDLKKSIIKKDNEKEPIKEEVIIKNKATKIPVLSYHRTVTSDIKDKYFKDNAWVNDLDEVSKELEFLYNNGWKTIDLDEFYCWHNKECDYEEKTFVITIDDGDSEAYYNLLPLFEKYNFKATMFSIGKEIPEVTEELNEPKRLKLGYDKILELRKNKSLLQVESHTYNMHHKSGKKKAVETLSYNELVQDFENNKKYNFKYLAYPYGIYTKDMLKATSNSDIKLAFKIRDNKYATRLDNKYEIARIEIDAFMKMDKFEKIFEYAKGE